MDNITIIQHNVHTWRTNKFLLTNTYLQYQPHIILLNSTGIKNDEPIKMYGYNTYKTNSSNELHDGSAILVKNNIKHTITDNFDTDILQITINTQTGPINISTTYLPPRRPFLPFPDFHRLATQKDPTYIIGDLNARHTIFNNNDCNNVGKAIKKLIDHRKIIHMGPNFNTFFSHNHASTPDIILTNHRTYHNLMIKPGSNTSSDHIPLIITITTQAVTIPSQPILNHTQANWENFSNDILLNNTNINTTDTMTQEQLDNSMQQWLSNITQAMKKHIPMKTTTTEQKTLTNNTIKQLTFWAQNITDNSRHIGWTRLKFATLKRIKQAIIKECKNIQSKNWEDKIKSLNKIHKDSKKFWSEIKKLKGNQNNNNNYILHNNEKIHDIQRQEHIFRQIWSKTFQISQEENINFDQNTENMVNDFLVNNAHIYIPLPRGDPGNLNNNSQLLYKITSEHVLQVIKRLKNNTPGNTKINKVILQKLPSEAIDTLTILLNISLSMGYFPKQFKHANIKLIPKANKPPSNPINYRPISLLEVTGKIFEKIINHRLRNHLEAEHLIPHHQHGFRTCRSTHTAIATLTESLTHTLTNNKICTIVTRDISKAFDKVWHPGLKYKLSNLLLPHTYTRLLSSFLDNRSASITLKFHIGPSFPLLSGVPQGSALSPTLFNIYTSDIPAPGPHCTNIAYADDITQIICQPGKSKRYLARKVEREIQAINTFEKQWKIQTNMNKFTILPIAIYKTEQVSINNNIFPYSDKAKILGLTVNIRGYNKQITNNKTKAEHALYTLKRFNHLNTNIKLNLIKVCILPILTYPPYPLTTLSKTSIRKLQRVQNKAIRYAYNEKHPYTRTITELHQLSNIKPINITLHEQALKTKLTLQNIIQDETYINLITQNLQNESEHSWFKTTCKTLENIAPLPLYK